MQHGNMLALHTMYITSPHTARSVKSREFAEVEMYIVRLLVCGELGTYNIKIKEMLGEFI